MDEMPIKVGDTVILRKRRSEAKVLRIGRRAAYSSPVGDVFELEVQGIIGTYIRWLDRDELIVLTPEAAK